MSETMVYRVTCSRGADEETYLQLRPLSAEGRDRLALRGWTVRQGRVARVTVERRIERLSRQDAALRGASSACHGYGLAAAGLREKLVRALAGAHMES